MRRGTGGERLRRATAMSTAGAAARASPARKFLVGLIGEGIQGSRSPALHEHEARHLGLALHYQLIDLARDGRSASDLPRLLDAAQAVGFAGVNITHPCKQAVLPLLDRLSADARGDRRGQHRRLPGRQAHRPQHRLVRLRHAVSTRSGRRRARPRQPARCRRRRRRGRARDAYAWARGNCRLSTRTRQRPRRLPRASARVSTGARCNTLATSGRRSPRPTASSMRRRSA